MKIIVGLGNPGRQYENTHHNMGFIALDRLSEKSGIAVNKLKFKALLGEGMLLGQRVLLVKPQTFMNLSGEAVRDIVNFYKPELSDIMLIYDDIDTELGKIRVRSKGSAGTHNGMRSVIYQLQDDAFPRVRIGIGRELGPVPLVSYVLSGFTAEERPLLETAVDNACDAVLCWLSEGIDIAMSRFNPKKEKRAAKDEPEEGKAE